MNLSYKNPNPIPKLQIIPSLGYDTNLKPYSSNLRCRSYHPRFFLNPTQLSETELEVKSIAREPNCFQQLVVLAADDAINRQLLSAAVLLRDEDGHLKQTLGDLAVRICSMDDAYTRVNLLLDDLVPLLLQNSDSWVSNRFSVASNLKEAHLKQTEAEKMLADKFIFWPDNSDPFESSILNTQMMSEIGSEKMTAGGFLSGSHNIDPNLIPSSAADISPTAFEQTSVEKFASSLVNVDTNMVLSSIGENTKIAFRKLISEKFVSWSNDIDNNLIASIRGENTTRCTQVILHVNILGVIDEEFEEIVARDDFKLILKHLMSVEGVLSGLASCQTVLLKGR